MSKRRKVTHNFPGVIADTMELPVVDNAGVAQRQAKAPAKKTGRRRSILFAVLAIMAGFCLGFVVRVAPHLPALFANIPRLVPSGPETATSPLPLEPGVDVLTEFGRKVEVPMIVEQVLPFMPQGGTHKYRVLGGYLLNRNGEPDKSRPLMAVFPTSEVPASVEAGAVVTVSGFVVMANGSDQTAAAVLQPEQERDLVYITARVNFWDRVTMFGDYIRLGLHR
jgi:hypothetical protein